MPDGVTPLVLTVFLLVLLAELANGRTDAPNAVATVVSTVSTRVVSPGAAVRLVVAFVEP